MNEMLADDLARDLRDAIGAALGSAVAEHRGWDDLVQAVADDLARSVAEDVLAVAASIAHDAVNGASP